MKSSRLVVARLTFVLVVAEVLLILLSWLLSAMNVEGVRPLLSSEGARWFLSRFASFVGAPWLAWLLVGAMAWGCLRGSSLLATIGRKDHRGATIFAAVLLALFSGFLLWLVAAPHATLLSATGSLWPSPFSSALVPLLALGVIIVCGGYGVACRAFTSLTDLCHSFVQGIAAAAPIFFLYVLFIQFLESLRYAFF